MPAKISQGKEGNSPATLICDDKKLPWCADSSVEAVQVKDEAKEKKKKKVKEVNHEWSLVNKQKPIWMRKP